jgi:hypothetical protein
MAKAMSARSKCSSVGMMSMVQSRSTRSGWSSARRCATRAPRSWLPPEALEAEARHQRDQILRHLPLA